MKSYIRKQVHCNARLTITSTQTVDGHTERTSTHCDALCRFEPKQTMISYLEQDTETVITVTESHTACITRHGGIDATFIIVKDESHTTTYTTSVGAFSFSIRGMEVSETRIPHGGVIQLHYAIEMNGSVASVNTISLHITMLDANHAV